MEILAYVVFGVASTSLVMGLVTFFLAVFHLLKLKGKKPYGEQCSSCVSRPPVNLGGDKGADGVVPWQFGGGGDGISGQLCKWLGIGCQCSNVGDRIACEDERGGIYDEKKAQGDDWRTPAASRHPIPHATTPEDNGGRT